MNHDDVSPPGSPNIVVVYMDDMGCSDIGCFGSEIETPHLDALAARGLRLNHYTTQPICSPARAALLSGRNAHAVSSGSSASGATRPMPQRPSPRTEQYYECRANLVHPLDNRSTLQKFNQLPPHQKPAAAGTRRFLPGGQSVHRQRVLPLIADRSFQVSLRVRHGVDDEGVLFAIGDVIGGMVMYLEGGRCTSPTTVSASSLRSDRRRSTPASAISRSSSRRSAGGGAVPGWSWTARRSPTGPACRPC
jgi:hypothetical protein